MTKETEKATTKDLYPAMECYWNYTKLKNGIAPRLKNAAKDNVSPKDEINLKVPAKNGFEAAKNLYDKVQQIKNHFDSKYNPRLTVSRNGLTVRVVGTLNDEFMAAYNDDMAAVVKDYPYFIPVTQTASHSAVGGNPNALARTDVFDLPPNSIMIVYPVAIGDQWNQTAIGNFVLWATERTKRANEKTNAWAGLPFLAYNGGFAFHGPIDAAYRDDGSYWSLTRGPVSHGCQRMEGEHIVELGVLLGCNVKGTGGCPDPDNREDATDDDIRVTVMEEFDHIPNPNSKMKTGPIESWDEIKEHFVGVDLSNAQFPRLYDNVPGDLKIKGAQAVNLTTNVEGRKGQKPAIVLHEFPSWDNRDTKRVVSDGCR